VGEQWEESRRFIHALPCNMVRFKSQSEWTGYRFDRQKRMHTYMTGEQVNQGRKRK